MKRQRHEIHSLGGHRGIPETVNEVLHSTGQALDPAARDFFEQRLGHDFSDVRVHADYRAAESARAVHALAYTAGRDVVFSAGQYRPGSVQGRRLLAHELAHVIQHRGFGGRIAPKAISTEHDPGEREADAAAERIMRGEQVPPIRHIASDTTLSRVTSTAAAGAGSATSAGTATGRSAQRARQIDADVLAAGTTDDFLVRAAAQAIGTDIRVRSMSDMISQLGRLTASGACLRHLNIYNHGNPSVQTVSGAFHVKSAAGKEVEAPSTGFSLSWLFNAANQAELDRLRNMFCCGAEMYWLGCSTAGVWAAGGQRTAHELRSNQERYGGRAGEFYQSVEDAERHGALGRVRFVGPVNVQSWANATCASISAATDFDQWRTTRSGVSHQVAHGGAMTHTAPQPDVACNCDPATGRVGGAAPGVAELRSRAGALREQALRPSYERTRSILGREQPERRESPEERSTRTEFEADQARFFEQTGAAIRQAVLERAGFAHGAAPATPDEALRVLGLWGLSIDSIAGALPALGASLSGRVTGSGHTGQSLAQQQRALEATLTPRGRESFMSMLAGVRRESFWNDYFTHNTIFVFPDLSRAYRYRGYTQTGTERDSSGEFAPRQVHVIHISRNLLNNGEIELASAVLVHELSHTVYDVNVTGRTMQPLEHELAELVADHPRITALRAGVPDAAAARETQIWRISQLIYDATGYAEGEIFVHLQQLTHQPDITIETGPAGARRSESLSGSRYILIEVERWMRQLRRIGIPPRMLHGILGQVRRRAALLYDRRIAAAPAGSVERQRLEVDKTLALSTFDLALNLAQQPEGE